MSTQEGENIFDTQVLSHETAEDSVERRELNLTNPEDLEVFLESAEGVYAEAFQYVEVAEDDDYERLGIEDISGVEIFETLQQKLSALREMIDHCRLNVIPNEGEIEDDKVELMQQLYDDMIFLRNHIQDTYSYLSEEIEDMDISAEQAIDEKKVESITDYPEEQATVFEVVKSDSEIFEQENIVSSEGVKPVFDTAQTELVETDSFNENLFKQVEQTVNEIRFQVEKKLNNLSRLFPSEERTEEIKSDFQELDVCLNRISDIQETIKGKRGLNEDKAILGSAFEKYERVAKEIEKNAQTIEQVLMQKHRESEVVEIHELKQEKNNSENLFPLRKDSNKNEVNFTDGIAEVETITIPSDADVSVLMKKVTSNQFFIDAERVVAEKLCEDFYRGVAENIPVAETIKNFEKLQKYIEKISTHPDMEYIDMRVCRILERVTAGRPEDISISENVKSKCNLVVRMMSDPNKTADSVQQVYGDLEEYVKAHESEWLAVCGLRIPVPGIEGVSTARSLREGLMIARDRHKGLQRHPEKKILLDKLVRELANVPRNGFDKDEISEIAELVRRIDEASSVENGNIQQEQKVQSNNDSLNNSYTTGPQLKRKTMEIESAADTEEILIQVSRKTEKKLAKDKPKHSLPQMESAQVMIDTPDHKTVEATAVTETNDPINQLIPNKRPTVIHSRPVHEVRSLTREYLADKKYASFFERIDISPKAFERILDTEITKIESETIDFIEKFLNEERVSPFEYMQDMLVEEVEELSMQPNIRDILAQKNIKYETFVAWIDRLSEMQSVVGDASGMKFGELYARWMVEGAMQFSEEREAA